MSAPRDRDGLEVPSPARFDGGVLHWLWFVVVGGVGGLGGAATVAVFGRVILGPSVHPWTTVGVIATLTGVLAATLGILSALAVAFQWLVLDRRVDQRVQSHRETLEREIRQSMRRYVQAIGELAMSWTRPVEELEQVADRILRITPDMPNVAPMMAERYLGDLTAKWTPAVGARTVEPGHLTETAAAALDAATRWADRAYETREYHDRGYAEWLKAKVAAWHKEPDTCLSYLAEARAAGTELHELVQRDRSTWMTFTSCTHGASGLDKLDRLLQMLGYVRPSWLEVRGHCRELDAIQRSNLWGVSRDNGNAQRIVVQGILDHATNTITWSIVGPQGGAIPGPADTTFDSVMQYVEDTWIPVRLVPAARPRLGDGGRFLGFEPDEEIIDRW